MQIFVTTTNREPPVEPPVEQYLQPQSVGNTCCLVGYHVCRLARLALRLVANHSIKTSLGVAVLRGVCWKIEIETSEFLL